MQRIKKTICAPSRVRHFVRRIQRLRQKLTSTNAVTWKPQQVPCKSAQVLHVYVAVVLLSRRLLTGDSNNRIQVTNAPESSK